MKELVLVERRDRSLLLKYLKCKRWVGVTKEERKTIGDYVKIFYIEGSINNERKKRELLKLCES